ncbi:MAG: zinc ribbon domain-containing protein [Candidatus Dormibacteraeota bacterium]|nr:zinc ribbon domain-containing protein [Candidatus Dormibacteraeota bacterium]
MRNCPRCGRAIPTHARFCAYCGAPLAPAAGAATVALWVLVLFWVGTPLALLIAGAYALALGSPDLAARAAGQQRIDPTQLQGLIVAIVIWAGLLFACQLAASVGLTLGRAWARVLGTIVAVAWSLTCIALPISILVVVFLWRPDRRRAAGAAQ